MINIAKVTSFLFVLKLGRSCVLILHLIGARSVQNDI